jgi:hypothetical protein
MIRICTQEAACYIQQAAVFAGSSAQSGVFPTAPYFRNRIA